MECVSSASSLSLAKLFVSKNALLMGYVSAPAWMSFAAASWVWAVVLEYLKQPVSVEMAR